MEKIHNVILVLKYFYDNRNNKNLKITRTKLRKSVGKGIKKSALNKKFVDFIVDYLLQYGLINESGKKREESKSGYLREYIYYEITERGIKTYQKINALKNDESIAILLFLDTIFKPL